MKKGQIYEGVIESVNFPNKALIVTEETDAEGEKKEVRTLVKGGIEGQKVSFTVNKVRKDKCQGRIREVLEKSPLETEEPICPNFGLCGGCNYQTLPYEEQLKLKKNQVLKLIDEVYQPLGENEAYIYDGILPSPEITGYRNKMEFSFGDEKKDGPLTLGLHKKGSFHDILDADCCKIVHKDFTTVLSCVRNYCREEKIPYYKKNTHLGVLRHLLVRRASSSGELLVCLVVSSQQLLDWTPLTEQLINLSLEGTLCGFLLITNDSLGDVVQSDKTEILVGKDFIIEKILGLQFKISPFSFFQTNSKGAEVLYQRTREYILGSAKETDTLKDKVVFDLYCGTGTISQMIAPIAKRVIGVEIVAEAVEAARENARINGLHNCDFIAGDVLKVIDGISEKPDFIVLDPPRDGVHPRALRKIIDFGVENVVYVSCKPTSLVRDLEVFQAQGYRLVRVSNVDMFPGTAHVETVVLLTHKKPTSYIEVTMDYDTIVSNQKPGRATYKMITEYVKEKYNLVVKSTTIAEVKRSFGIEVGDYNVKEEKTNYRKEKITPEKRNAVEDALRHFGVIE